MWTHRDLVQESPPLDSAPGDDAQVRDIAIEHIQRKRRFQARAVAYAAICTLLTVIWAISEYNNAGGWPSSGFSQSSSIPHTWNIWIIYPVLGLGLLFAIDAWNTFGRRPISETEIQHEVDRITGPR
jgi:protein-S-isoprenylcysteine O-methyltransferase Ste14